MASQIFHSSHQNSTSQRGLAMFLSVASAVILSPLYITTKKNNSRYFENKYYWNSGYVLPMVLVGLIIAIKTTSSLSSVSTSLNLSPDPSWVLRIGNSSWGLAIVLVMLMFVLSWQESVQQFFWR